MVEINGVQYPGKTAEENTADMVNYINKYCADNNIKNSKGETIYIDASETNPLYMMIFGQGYLLSILQKLVQSAGNGFSIADSSDRQLGNIAEIARVKRNKASPTTIVCLIYAEEDKECTISLGLTVEIAYGNSKVVFHPAYEIVVPPGGVQSILLISETTGSYNIEAGAIQSFVENPEGLRTIESYAAIPGTREETIAEMRARLQSRSSTTTLADRCAEAIQQLDGVSRCTVYVNTSSVDSIDINGITLPPRQSLLIVQGFNNNIAKTYYSYMLVKTTEGPAGRTILQNYITQASQNLPVYIIEPDTAPIYMRVYTEYELDDKQKIALRDLLCSNASNTFIGGSVDVGQLMKVVGNQYPVQGLELSLTNASFTYKVTPHPDQLIIYNTANIQIIASVEENQPTEPTEPTEGEDEGE